MFEHPPSPELGRVGRGQVIELMKANGKEHPETKALLAKFIEQGEKEVFHVREKKESYRTNIKFSVDVAKIFYEAGFLQEALNQLDGTEEEQYLDGSLSQAYQSGEEDLYNEILDLINEIETKLGL